MGLRGFKGTTEATLEVYFASRVFKVGAMAFAQIW
jgi:hypothetical protein